MNKKYLLYHYPISPFCRKIRFFMDEFGIKYDLVEIKTWERDIKFLKLNPANTVPVLFDKVESLPVIDSFLITRYLAKVDDSDEDFERYSEFFGEDLFSDLEISRLEIWFDKKFYSEVSKYILEEKVYNRYINPSAKVDVEKLKIAKYNLEVNMDYMEFLLRTRKYLAGEKFSLADIAASTELSVIDYFGDVPWKKYPETKNWYAAIKSKKGFKSILKDKIEGYTPYKDYNNLDF